VPLGACGLVQCRDDDERGDVARPDGGEVSQVDGRDGDDAEPLADGDYRGVRAAEPSRVTMVDDLRSPSR
jgi:hypothetical protein